MRSLAALGMTWHSRRSPPGMPSSQRRGISLRLAEAFVWLCNEIPRCARDDMDLSADLRRPVLGTRLRMRVYRDAYSRVSAVTTIGLSMPPLYPVTTTSNVGVRSTTTEGVR